MRIIVIGVLTFFAFQTFAQTTAVSIGDDFKLMSGYTKGNATGYSVILPINRIVLKATHTLQLIG